MYSIHILFSLKTNKYYVGSTDDLQRRLKHHIGGSTPSTKAGAPDWEIRYTKTVPDRATALKRELEIKKKKSRNYLEWLIQKGNVNKKNRRTLPYCILEFIPYFRNVNSKSLTDHAFLCSFFEMLYEV